MDTSHRPSARTPLWREAVGAALRSARARAGRRLVDVAGDAGVSPQYLSELERGMKDPSSEVLEAVAGALGLGTDTLAVRAADRIAAARGPRVLQLSSVGESAREPARPVPQGGPAAYLLAA